MPEIVYLFKVILLSKEPAGRVWPVKINGCKLVIITRIPISLFISKLYDQNLLKDISCYRYRTGKIIRLI